MQLWQGLSQIASSFESDSNYGNQVKQAKRVLPFAFVQQIDLVAHRILIDLKL